jgi:hypothetical protein
MAQRTQKKLIRRIRPDPPRRATAPAARRSPFLASRRGRVPWWAIALVALGCVGILYLVLTSGGGEASAPITEDEPAIGSAPDGDVPAGVESSSTIASSFPRPATGERLELRVLSLGDDPSRCEAVSLRVGGEVRTAYHHDCSGRDAELAFFLVRLTGLAADPVTVDLTRFELVTKSGRRLTPLDLKDVIRRFPVEIALGPDVSRKGWVVFAVPGVPASLRYADADRVLVVRFPGTWL